MMLFDKCGQSNLGSREITRMLLIALAIGAAFCWAWVLERGLDNEREAWENRFREQKEQQLTLILEDVKDQLRSEQQACSDLLSKDTSVQTIREILKNHSLSAVLVETPEFQVVTDIGQSKESVIRAGVSHWPSDEEGRDSLAARLITDCRDESIWKALLPRLLGNEGPPMKSSFRHWLIEEAKKRRGNVNAELDTLSFSEGMRATGRPSDRGIYFTEKGIGLWWSEASLLSLFEERGITVKIGMSGKHIDLWETPWKVHLNIPENAWRIEDTLWGHSRLFILGALCCVVLVLVLTVSTWIADREQRLARLKTDLAASVAHELRTPLAGQLILLESLSGELVQSEEERKEYLEMALRENRRLSALAEQFLTFSRLDRGKIALHGQQVEISTLVEGLLDEWRDRFDSVTVIGVEGLVAHLDKAAVYSILRNLIENAWKYTGKRKQLEITIEQVKGKIVLSVKDNGAGLSKKNKALAFRKFWRVDQKLSRQTDGLGLGLFIVKNLAEAHGGSVIVEDSNMGGSVFIVTLEEL